MIKKISVLIVSMFGFMAVAAAPAAAREVNCPRDSVRTEVVTPLPDSWWQTPQVGNLQSTSVAEIGGETTLVCQYRAYGTTVSVMRHPPAAAQNCTAHEGGFTCRRVAGGGRPERAGRDDGPVTFNTGPLSVPQTWMADLDVGSIDSGTKDFWFRAETARNRYLEPQNGARFGILDGGAPSEQNCRDTHKTTDNISVRRLTVGTYVCYRTNEGRIGAFRVNERIGRSPGTMVLGFTTWE